VVEGLVKMQARKDGIVSPNMKREVTGWELIAQNAKAADVHKMHTTVDTSHDLPPKKAAAKPMSSTTLLWHETRQNENILRSQFVQNIPLVLS